MLNRSPYYIDALNNAALMERALPDRITEAADMLMHISSKNPRDLALEMPFECAAFYDALMRLIAAGIVINQCLDQQKRDAL